MCDACEFDTTNYLVHFNAFHTFRANDMPIPLAEIEDYLQVTVPCPAVPECKEARRP